MIDPEAGPVGHLYNGADECECGEECWDVIVWELHIAELGHSNPGEVSVASW